MTKKHAIIISGFPGVGKSFLKKSMADRTVFDSDSFGFSWADKEKGIRHPDWPRNYLRHIQRNLHGADIILVSSHDVVRNSLVAAGLPFILAYPELSMKEEYVERYRARQSPTAFITLLEKYYEIWIEELMSQKYCVHLVLRPGQYLSDILY